MTRADPTSGRIHAPTASIAGSTTQAAADEPTVVQPAVNRPATALAKRGALWWLVPGALAAGIIVLGNPSAAVTEYRKVLQRLPRRPAAVLGLAKAAAAAGDRTEATRAATEFLQIWHRADPDRPELREAREILRR